MFKDLIDNCRISLEEFTAPIETLKSGHIYVVGCFSKGNVVKMVSYKDGVYVISDKVGFTETDVYKFESLQRAYCYFEELFNK